MPASPKAAKPAAGTGKAAAGKGGAAVYAASQSEIKDDLPALVACLRTGKGQLTRQEAALLLLHHATGAGAHADLLAAGAVNACLGVLDAAAAASVGGGGGSGPEATAAASILLQLSKPGDPATCEAIAKGKGAAAALYRWLGRERDAAGRAAAQLLAALAAEPLSRAALMKGLEGGPPWGLYASVLDAACCHDVACHAADLVRSLVRERPELAEAAGAAGLLGALLSAARRHKSAAAAGAAAAGLRAMLEGAGGAANRARVMAMPDAVRVLVDLLGPPPAAAVAWEQTTYAHMLDPSAPPKPPPPPPPPRTPPPAPQAGGSRLSGSGSGCREGSPPHHAPGSGVRRVALAEPPGSPGAGGDAEGEGDPGAQKLRPRGDGSGISHVGSLQRTRSARGARASARGHHPDGAPQLPGELQPVAPPLAAGKPPPPPPLEPPGPLLCRSSVALKWDGPVPPASRAAAAGCLRALAEGSEAACALMGARLAAPRLAALVAGAVEGAAAPGAGAGAKKAKKKGLSLDPDTTAMLAAAVDTAPHAGANALARVAATPKALAAVVTLCEEAEDGPLRRSAKALAAQAALLAEAEPAAEAAGVPPELTPGPAAAPMRLTAAEARALAAEYPGLLAGGQLPPRAEEAAVGAAPVAARR
ncbi:MAG: hypothetical protein J3K34DRAFT_488565 [Monoraphidium minutum]|nr:MAG: hypothetical protein J3K34DRAFT_488565 [Monoraphidium minutum]